MGGSLDRVSRARRFSVRLDFLGSRLCGFRMLGFARVLRRSPASDIELPLRDRPDRADDLTMLALMLRGSPSRAHFLPRPTWHRRSFRPSFRDTRGPSEGHE